MMNGAAVGKTERACYEKKLLRLVKPGCGDECRSGVVVVAKIGGLGEWGKGVDMRGSGHTEGRP